MSEVPLYVRLVCNLVQNHVLHLHLWYRGGFVFEAHRLLYRLA